MIMKSLVALFIVLSFSSFYLGKCLSEPLAPALYVFGDSLVDSGNNNWLLLPRPAQANYKPYGIDFPGSVSTGRVTNGKNVPDFIAEYLGLPYPARVKQPFRPPSLTGYNYASAGGGILPETGPKNCLDLGEQVLLFNGTKNNILKPAFPEQAQLEEHLAKSIFFIWVGNNDYLLNYYSAATNTSQDYTPQEFADLLALQLSEKIKVLHSLGARKIVVFEGPPYGCIPIYYNKNGECIDSKNTNAQQFNSKLQEMIQSLSSEFSDAYFSLGKAYDLTYDAIVNPSNYGLTNVTSPCCELATLLGHTLIACKWLGNKCENRDEYLFWDAAHPTQVGHGILGGQCINNSAVCTPYSIQDLVQLPTKPALTLLSAA
ncbi:GDSL esterase/lipase 7-like [Silene latifolia]|uniref:GDSL esterase/lipase 7-like n=1 Tax=Silene latifolia TaxID=37657 RepID=UPI003D76ABED